MAKYDIKKLIERIENGERLKFLFFWGHTKRPDESTGNFCFSQWFESPFTVDGIECKTSEHWMMSQKASLFNDLDLVPKIIACKKPGEVKELGRQIKNFDENSWQAHRYEIVRTGNIHKFTQDNDLKNYILQTGDRILVEASPVDTIWGIGLSKDSNDIENFSRWRGFDLFGFALMETRDFIKNNDTIEKNPHTILYK